MASKRGIKSLNRRNGNQENVNQVLQDAAFSEQDNRLNE